MDALLDATVLGATTTAAAAALGFFFIRHRGLKAARTTKAAAPREEEMDAAQKEEEMDAAPAPPQRAHTFPLLEELAECDEFHELVRLLPAVASARLALASRRLHTRVTHPHTAEWCAESRRELLLRRERTGNLPVGFQASLASGSWTLERLHLCEKPPRFPKIYFAFASDRLDGTDVTRKIDRVAALLRRHPRLRLRIHGFAQPDAPNRIGEALAQARAVAVRQRLLLALSGVSEWSDEDPNAGVRSDRSLSPWLSEYSRTTVVGRKLEAKGGWRQDPRNRNFGYSDDEDDDDDDDDGEGEGDDDDFAAKGKAAAAKPAAAKGKQPVGKGKGKAKA